MTFDPKKPCTTARGNPVDIYPGTLNSTHSIAGTERANYDHVWQWDHHGVCKNEDPKLQLINIPEEHEKLVHFYRGQGGGIYASVGPIKNQIASKRVTFTEGEFEK